MDLSPKLDFCMALTPYNRPYVRLMNTYNPVFNTVTMIIVHLLLLIEKRVDYQQILVIFGLKWNMLVAVQHIVYRA